MKRVFLVLLLWLPLALQAQNNLTKVRVTPHWTPQCQFAGIYMALEKGFYREAGLDVEIIHPSASVLSSEMLRQGQTDIVTTQLIQAIMSREEGLPLVNILQTSQNSALMVVSHEELENVQDLNHKKIGRFSAGFSEIAIAAASKVGLDIEWVPFFSNTALYISGAIDATLCYEFNEYFQLLMSGTPISEKRILRFRDVGYNIPEDGMYVLESFYNENPELVKKFVEATKKGWTWIRESEENKTETIDCVMTMVKKLGLPISRINQQFMLDIVLKLLEDENGNVPFSLRKDKFEEAVQLLLHSNFILNTVEYESLCR